MRSDEELIGILRKISMNTEKISGEEGTIHRGKVAMFGHKNHAHNIYILVANGFEIVDVESRSGCSPDLFTFEKEFQTKEDLKEEIEELKREVSE